MCNCGNKRDEFVKQSSSKPGNTASVKEPEKMWNDVNFVYTGNSALSVTGTVTGKRYRFNFMGDTQLIDYRDASTMSAVPVLRRIK